MALANGDRHFIAPRNIREMGRDLAPLLDFIEGDDLLVWGWDYAIKNHLLRLGVAAKLLPSDEAITALRQRSGRASAHHLLAAFHAAHPTGPYTGESILVHDIEDIPPYATQHGHVILKDPLSSSGKGLRHVNLNENEDENENRHPDSSPSLKKIKSWTEALLRRHGYLTAEPYYNKVQDFAMEFRADSNGCHFIGYSYFNTNAHGRYESNLLAPDAKIEDLLARHIPHSALHEVRDWVIGHSELIIPTEWDTTKHPLYFGIDMMIVRTTDKRSSLAEGKSDGQQTTYEVNFQFSTFNSQFKIHPCVEINLRLNMGIIAHEVRSKLLAPGVEGAFYVTAFPTEEAVCQFRQEQIEKYPPVCREGKYVSGYHSLTPLHPHARHHAYIICR